MNRKLKGPAIIFVLITTCLLILSILPGPKTVPNQTSTLSSTSTSTFTPPPNLGFVGITTLTTSCYDWSYQELISIDPLELVYVLGRNISGTWLMVRWPKFTTACWVESKYVNANNFTLEELFVITAPFPPPNTATSTLLQPTHTNTVSSNRTPAIPTKTPPGGQGNPANTIVPPLTSTSSLFASNTPFGLSTNTLNPTTTKSPLPASTNTPFPTATNSPLPPPTSTPFPSPTNTPCPTNPGGQQPPGQCR